MEKYNVFIKRLVVVIILLLNICNPVSAEDSSDQLIKDEIYKLQIQKEQIEAKIAELSAKLKSSGTITYNRPAGPQDYQKAKLPTNISAIKELSIQDKSFIQNNPYGFEKNVAYKLSFGGGQVIQWINENECLYNFAGMAASQLYWSSVGYFDLGKHNGNDFLSTKYSLLFEYVGVFSYQTVNGSQNSVPKFKVIFYE